MIDFNDPALTGEKIRTALGLAPHPEGGWFRETWRDVPADPQKRGAATAILFLLAEGAASAWHRVDAAEIWLFHAGAPVELAIAEGANTSSLKLGEGLNFQAVVPAFAWQAARSTGKWSLVSCVVAPAFEFAGFELAADMPMPPAFLE